MSLFPLCLIPSPPLFFSVMRRRKTKYDVGHQDANGRVRSGHCTPHTLITPVCLSIHTPSHTLITPHPHHTPHHTLTTPLTTPSPHPSPHPSLHPSPHPFPHVPGGQLSIRVIRNIFAHTSHQHTSHQHTSHQHTSHHTYLSCTLYRPLWYTPSLDSPIQPPQGSAVPVFMAIDDEKETTFGRDEAQPKKGTLSSAHMGSSVHTCT